MPFFDHSFDSVEQYLHHRKPYLLVDRIIEITRSSVVTEFDLQADEPFLAGHFPGAPIMPGAMMQELTTQSAGILIAAHYNPMRQFDTADPTFNEYALGVLVRVKHARYKSFARPSAAPLTTTLQATITLSGHVEHLFDFDARVTVDDDTIMRNAFQLTNIPSSVLTGETSGAGT